MYDSSAAAVAPERGQQVAELVVPGHPVVLNHRIVGEELVQTVERAPRALEHVEPDQFAPGHVPELVGQLEERVVQRDERDRQRLRLLLLFVREILVRLIELRVLRFQVGVRVPQFEVADTERDPGADEEHTGDRGHRDQRRGGPVPPGPLGRPLQRADRARDDRQPVQVARRSSASSWAEPYRFCGASSSALQADGFEGREAIVGRQAPAARPGRG